MDGKSYRTELDARLDRLRFSLGTDWGELARRLGISRSMLGFIRRGEKKTSPGLAHRIDRLEREASEEQRREAMEQTGQKAQGEVVVRVVVEQRPAPAPAGAAAWGPKGGRRAVTPAPKYGIGKKLYHRPAFRKGWHGAKFVVAEIRIHAVHGVSYYDWHGNGHKEDEVEPNAEAAYKRWPAKNLLEREGGK